MTAPAPWSELARRADAASAETFVRSVLERLEVEHRAIALRALGDWAGTGVVASSLFLAIAGLKRSSWGSFCGLLRELRAARRAALRSADTRERERVEGARVLARIAAIEDERLDPDIRERLAPLAELCRASTERLRVGGLLAMPIALRNRIAHDAPSDSAWWEAAADAVAPLAAWHADRGVLDEVAAGQPGAVEPWLVAGDADGESLALVAIDDDLTPHYAAAGGDPRALADRRDALGAALRALLGASAGERGEDLGALLARLAPEDVRGVLLGDLLVGRVVGEGGFATVHVGRQVSTGRKVAVKVLKDGLPEEAAARFRQEAEFLSRFDHPGIVRVLGYGEDAWSAPRAFSLAGEAWYDRFAKGSKRRSYIALEWIEGETLDAAHRRVADAGGPGRGDAPSVRAVLAWFAEAAAALARVHATGLVHRDVKPGNLMLAEAAEVGGEPRVVLMDFGIARSRDEEGTLRAGDATVGTPAYMSPEQLRAADAEAEVGPASDLYSLGASFYEVLTGRRCFDHGRRTGDEVRADKLGGRRPEAPGALTPSLGWETEVLLQGCLEPEPSDRIASMDSLAADLRRVIADEPITYRRPSLGRRVQLGYRRNRLVANLVGVFAVVAIAAAAVYLKRITDELGRTERRRQEAQREADEADRQRGEAEQAEDVAREQSDRATASAGEARRRLGEVLREQGRQQLRAGRPGPALVQLAAALDAGDDGAAARLLRRRAADRIAPRVATFDGHGGAVAWARFTADGTVLVTTGGGERLVWDATTGSRMGVIPVGTEDHAADAFSPDGRLVATLASVEERIIRTNEDDWVSVRDLATGAEQARLISPGEGIHEVAWDGDRIATGGWSGTVRLFASDGFVERAVVPLEGGRDEPVERLLFLPGDGGAVVAVHRGGRVRVLERDDGAVRLELDVGADLVDLAPSPDGAVLATGGRDGITVLWHARTGERLGELVPEELRSLVRVGDQTRDPVGRIHWSPDGARVVVVGWQRLRVWERARPERPVRIIDPSAGIEASALAPDGEVVAIAFSPGYDQPGVVELRDLASGRLLARHVAHDARIAGLRFAPGGRRLVSWSEDGRAVLWDPGERIAPFEPAGLLRADRDDEVAAAAISADGRLLAVVRHDEDLDGGERPDGTELLAYAVPVADRPAPAEPLAIVPLPNALRTLVAVADDGGRVAVAGHAFLAVWDAASGRSRVRTTNESPTALALHPDGRRLLIGGEDDRARIVDLESEALSDLLVVAGRVDEVAAVAWSPDGARFLVLSHHEHEASVPGAVRIFEATDGRPVVSFGVARGDDGARVGHAAQIRTARFSPDGSRVVTASLDGTARVWDAATGRELAVLAGDPAGLTTAAWAPEGGSIVATGAGGTAVVFDAATGRRAASLDLGDRFDRIERAEPIAGGLIVCTSEGVGSRAVALWDGASGRLLATFGDGETDSVVAIGVAEAGRGLLVARGESVAVHRLGASRAREALGALLDRVPWRLEGAILVPRGEAISDGAAVEREDAGEPVAAGGDPLEPNDEVGLAFGLPLAVGGDARVVTVGGTDAADWYRLAISGPAELVITVAEPEGTTTVSLYDGATGVPVFDGSVTPYDVGREAGEPARVAHRFGAGAGEYLLLLGRWEGSPVLEVELALAEWEPPDAFEPNDGVETAAPLPPGEHGVVVAGEDWYRIDLPAHHRLALRIAASEREYVSVSLHDAAGALDAMGRPPEVSQTFATGEVRLVHHSGDAAAPLLLRVAITHAARLGEPIRTGPADGAAYRLALELAPWQPADRLEPNDGPGQARALVPGEHADLVLQHDDWYRVKVPAGREVYVQATSDPAAGDLVVEVTNGAGYSWGRSARRGTGRQAVVAKLDRDGEVLIHVSGDRAIRYTLRADVVFSAVADALEPNDLAATARKLEPGRHAALTLEGEDWYRVVVGKGEELLVRLDCQRQNPAEVVGVEVRDAAGETVLRQTDTTPADVRRLSVHPGGEEEVELRLRVFFPAGRFSFAPIPYELELSTRPWAAADRFEPNDDLEHATTLEPGSHEALVVQDRDVYRIAVPAGRALRVTARPVEARFDLGLRVFDLAHRAVLPGRRAADGAVGTTYLPPEASELHVVVGGDPAGYVLEVELVEMALDRFEPNDAPDAAHALEPGMHAGLRLVAIDCYLVEVEPGKTVTATVRFEHARGDINLALVDGQGQILARTGGTGDEETLEAKPGDGSIRIAVFGEQNDYELEVTVTD